VLNFGIPQVGHEGHTTCCLFTVVMDRGTFQWKGQYENAALDTVLDVTSYVPSYVPLV